MVSYIKSLAAWLVLAGHVFFGWWIRSKVLGASDSVALKAGARSERKAPSNKAELEEALREDKI